MVKNNTSSQKNTANVFQLSRWDGKKSTYPDFRKEVTKLANPHGISWILHAARALFSKMQNLQEESKKKRRNFKCTFDSHDDSNWVEALQSREHGCVEAQLAVVKVDTLKQRFGSNFTEFQKCGFTDETKHAGALENALEQKLLEMNITLLSALTDAIFSEKSDGSMNKDALRQILVTAEIRNLLDGGNAKDIDEWFDQPWLMPAVVVWFSILWKYEGLNENVDLAFLDDFNEIAASGLGPQPENIADINSKFELLLEPAPKAFATVQEMCYHLRNCALVKIIKKWAKGTGKQGEAWKLADNSIVAASRTNTLLSTTIVNNAIGLAQRHLDRDDPEEEQTLTTGEDEITTLKAQLAEAQKSITALQAGASEPKKRKWGKGAKGEGEKGKGGPDRSKWRVCCNCGKKHSGDPPEEHCFDQDLDAKLEKLQQLIKRKKQYAGGSNGTKSKEKDREETAKKVAFLNKDDDK